MKLGMGELILIAIVALLVLGPDKLPVYAKKLGQALGEIKKYSSEITDDIKENIVEPLNETVKPLKEAVEPIADLQKGIEGSFKEVTKSINDVGKLKPEPVAETKAEETAEAQPVAEPAETAAEEVKEEIAETKETA